MQAFSSHPSFTYLDSLSTWRWRLLLCLLFAVAVAVLSWGIWEPTGLTGKDEYLLGLRTPMEMMEKDVWLVPFLDDMPRVRKPPLLYWLGRASFETFGPSLFSARIVTVFIAALLVLTAALTSVEVSRDRLLGILTGVLLLSMFGLATEARRFMLDVPVATASVFSFYAFLRWWRSAHSAWLAVCAATLAAGFLFKGPIVALVCGGGILALWGSGKLSLTALWGKKGSLFLAAFLFAALAFPWFYYVQNLYPDVMADAYEKEMEARQLWNISPKALFSLLLLALPWSFAALVYGWTQRHDKAIMRFALLWLLATLLPFFFILTFERYLIGSLVPLAMICALGIRQGIQLPGWARHIGGGISLLFALLLTAFAFWFERGGWPWALPVIAYFVWAWWMQRGNAHRIAAAMLLWLVIVGVVFPRFGVNDLPRDLPPALHDRQVILFDGPQPAMLPILAQRVFYQTSRLRDTDLASPDGRASVVFVRTEDELPLRQQASALGFSLTPAGSYRTLSSMGSGIRFARQGAGKEDWKVALATRDLGPLQSRVLIFEARRVQ